MNSIDKPNVELALAASYNTRGITGFTNIITNSLDQIKRNSIYEPVKNSLTGKTTLYLARRPGVTFTAFNVFGASGQLAYLVTRVPGVVASFLNLQYNNSWVFSTLNSPADVRVSSTSATTTIFTSANYFPQYVGRTHISGTDTVVLQSRNSSNGDTRVDYASAIGSWTQITDGDFPAASAQVGKMEHMDGFAFIMTEQSRIYNSNLNSLALWDSSDYISKQIRQDPAVGLAKFGNQLLAFGQASCEVYVNAGSPSNSPLRSVPQLASDVGMVSGHDKKSSGHYYTILDNKLYFVGRLAGAARSVGLFSWNGQTMEKVSNVALDKLLSTLTYTTSQTIYSVNTVSFMGQSAVSIALTAVSDTTQKWIMYFPQWNDWFEWSSTVFCPINSAGSHLGVGTSQDILYYFDRTENYLDATAAYTFLHQFKLPQNGNEKHSMPMAGVVGDTARSAISLNVEFSDDDGQNWTTARAIDMTSEKKSLYRCGGFRNRHVRLSNSSNAFNVELRLEKFVARVA